MATSYDLDHAQLNSYLQGYTSSSQPTPFGALSSGTEAAIVAAVTNNNLFTGDSDTLGAGFETDTAGSTISLDLTTLDTIAPGGADKFFLELGSQSTINIAASYGSLVATGDGESIKVDDYAGNDTLVAGAGHDTLIGGGASYLIAGSGNDSLSGGNDTSASDTLQAGVGNDTLTVLHGNNALYGGSGASTINAGDGGDTIYGSTGSLTINTTSDDGKTTIYTGPGAETINATHGNDTIYVGYTSKGSSSTDVSNDDSIAAGGSTNTHIIINADDGTTTHPLDGVTKITFYSGGSSTETTLTISGDADVTFKRQD